MTSVESKQLQQCRQHERIKSPRRMCCALHHTTKIIEYTDIERAKLSHIHDMLWLNHSPLPHTRQIHNRNMPRVIYYSQIIFIIQREQ